ncbi:hypothetical protein V3F56_03340 [Moorellaceae bacterium AZ2]
MRQALLTALIFLLGFVFPVGPAGATVESDIWVDQQVAQVQGSASSTQSGGGTAGIEPVSPEQLANKLTHLVDEGVSAASPILDSAAKLILALAGVLLLFFIVSGKVVSRAIGTIIAVAFGLLLWYAAPYIVAMLKWFTLWLQS